MEEQVILKLSTYDNLQMELIEAQDEIKRLEADIDELKKNKGIFKANDLGSTVYIELDEKGIELVNNMISEFGETHEVKQVEIGRTITYFHKKVVEGDV